MKNVVYALFRTLKESPIGDELKQLESVEKLSFKREPYEELSREAIAYSVYKYADIKGIKTYVFKIYIPKHQLMELSPSSVCPKIDF